MRFQSKLVKYSLNYLDLENVKKLSQKYILKKNIVSQN